MVLNKSKIKRKNLIQISLVFFGLLIIFFTYFYSGGKDSSLDKVEEKEIQENVIEKEGFNTFENITYEGKDSNNNNFMSLAFNKILSFKLAIPITLIENLFA